MKMFQRLDPVRMYPMPGPRLLLERGTELKNRLRVGYLKKRTQHPSRQN